MLERVQVSICYLSRISTQIICNRITNVAIHHIAENLHLLKYLDLTECLLISSLQELATGCPLLETLILTGAEYLMDDSFDNISSFYALKVLDLVRCKRITDLTLRRIEEGCPSLQVLEIGMNKTSDPAVQHLRSRRTQLNIKTVASSTSSVKNSGSIKIHPNRNALRSLMYDLKQIQADPLPLVSAHPLEGDMYVVQFILLNLKVIWFVYF
jgi:hypothetical protein